MPRSWESGLGILLQGKLPRSADQPSQPAGSGHEAKGQRGKKHTLGGFESCYSNEKWIELGNCHSRGQ